MEPRRRRWLPCGGDDLRKEKEGEWSRKHQWVEKMLRERLIGEWLTGEVDLAALALLAGEEEEGLGNEFL